MDWTGRPSDVDSKDSAAVRRALGQTLSSRILMKLTSPVSCRWRWWCSGAVASRYGDRSVVVRDDNSTWAVLMLVAAVDVTRRHFSF